MRPAGTRCICEFYWHNFTSYNNNSFTRSTLLTGLSQNPRGIPQPRITLTSQAQGTKILLTTCQTSSPVEVWHMRVLAHQWKLEPLYTRELNHFVCLRFLRFGENEIFGAKLQTSYFPKLIKKTVGVQSTVCGMFQCSYYYAMSFFGRKITF
jgi:hypothetical protein